MYFSLIMGTIGRSTEVKNFLHHLDRQTYRKFELIVVDQNKDSRLVPLFESYKQRFKILHLRSKVGLSRARNVGLKHVSGDMVAFPDDDCWYPSDLLERVAFFLQEEPYIDGVTGIVEDEFGIKLSSNWDRRAGTLTSVNLWRRQRSVSIFLRGKVIQAVGLFNEDLGVGSGTPWGSGEESEYLLRALKQGYRIDYDPSIIVHHSQPNPGVLDSKKAADYARGMGYVLRKHGCPAWHLSYWELRSLAGLIKAFLCRDRWKMSIHWANIVGRLEGWRCTQKQQ